MLLHAVPPARRAVPAVARRRAGAGSRRSAASRRCGRARARGARAAARRPATTARSRRRTRRCARTPRARTRAASRRSTVAVVGAQLLEQRPVLIGARHDRDPLVVLGRGARHRRAADVDGLDVGPLEERVEVRHDEVERRGCRASRGRRGATPCRGRRAGRRGSSGAASSTRSSSISGTPVTSSTVVTGMPGVGERGRGSARRHQLDAELVQRPREVDEAGLVPDREQRALDLRVHGRAPARRSCTSRSITSG